MTPKNTARNARTLQLDRYTTTLTPTALRQRLEEATATDPMLNDSFLTESPHGGLIVSGFRQHGDIVIALAGESHRQTAIVEFRKGDRALVTQLLGRLGRDFRKARPSPATEFLPFENLAQFLQFLRRSPIGKRIVIAESAIDSALLCGSEAMTEFVEALDFVKDSAELRPSDPSADIEKRIRLNEFRTRHRRPFVTLHEGRKLRLPHRLKVPHPQGGPALILHFAPLPRNRHLLGYIAEERHAF
jgi:hypothetical protein